MSKRQSSSQNSQRKSKPKPNKNIKTENSQQENQEHNTNILANKCVRFLLSRMHTNLLVRRSEIVENVFDENPGKSFDAVLNKASTILNKVYGLKVEIVEPIKKYLISNVLPYASYIPNDIETDLKNTILFLVLMHVFMMKDNATDESLWSFLNEFGIDPTTKCKSIGNVKLYIYQTLVKQHYIEVENTDPEAKKRFRWGSRAVETVSKMDILKFVGQTNDINVETYVEQYNDAVEQFGRRNSDSSS